MTRKEYLEYIIRDFKRENKTQEIYDALDDTLYELTTEFPFQVIQSSTDIPLLTDTYQYDFPVTYSMLIGDIRYIDTNGDGFILNKLTKSQFDSKYPDIETSTTWKNSDPVDFTIYGNDIFVAPYLTTVNATTKLIVNGATLSSPLTLPTSEPQFPDQWREIIKRGTLWRLFLGIENDNKYQQNLSLYAAGIEKMKQIDLKKEGIIQTDYQGF